MRSITRALVVLIAMTSGSIAAMADTVTVAVAANFAAPLREMATLFEASSGHHVRIVTGATGTLFAQAVNGAPFDVLLAADQARPAALIERGFAEATDRLTYAEGRLVLWTRRTDAPLGDEVAARAALSAQGRRVAIANPRLAPYGVAAREVLDKLDLAHWRGDLVVGQNVLAAYQYAASGNVDLAFVAAASVIRDGELTGGSGWLVPARYHAPIRQDAVLLARARQSAAARAFFEFLGGAEAARVTRRFGFGAD